MDLISKSGPFGNRYLTWLVLCMLVLALFLHLGRNSVMMGEAQHGQIALEMKVSNNYIAPTDFGELYQRNPPVFTWVVLGSFALFGETEFALRMVSVLSLLIMMGGHFAIVRRHTEDNVAFYSAIFLALTPTVLFWLSILGEIDLFYSCITYLSIIGFYHLRTRERNLAAYSMIYGLGAIGFLTNGLPSLFFIAATVGGYSIYQKARRSFFCLQHLAGMLLFGLILGAYFFAYSQKHSPGEYFATLWEEFSGRTVTSQGRNLPMHAVTFPFRILAGLAPAVLFGLPLWWIWGLRSDLLKDRFNRFCIFIFGFNIFPYFLFPGTKMTDIVMLFPLLLIVLLRVYFRAARLSEWTRGVVKIAIPVLLGLLIPGSLATLFVPEMQAVPGLHLFVTACVAGIVALGLLFLRYRNPDDEGPLWLLQWLVIVFLAGRLAFDALILPARDFTGMHTRMHHHGLRIAEIVGQRPLYLWGEHDEHTFSHMIGYYVTREREQILSESTSRDCEAFYISLRQWVEAEDIAVYYTFDNPPHFLHLFRFKDCR